MQTLEAIAVNETFADVQDLVYHTVHKFQRAHGGEFSELLSEAHEIYMKADRDWIDGEGMSFPSYVRFRIWNGLIDHARKLMSRRNALPPVSNNCLLHLAAPVASSFTLPDFLTELGEDAREVVKILLQSPEDLMVYKANEEPSGYCTRGRIRDHLRGLGWFQEKISAAFQEIQEALQ